jgi:hypothetical protein
MVVKPSTERDNVWNNLKGFFAGLEQRQPELVDKIVPLLINLIGPGVDLSPEKIWNNRDNLDIGLDILSDWLKNNRYNTFNIPLNPEEQLKKGALLAKLAAEGKKISSAKVLFEKAEINQSQFENVNTEINSLSKCIKEALPFGYRGKQIFGVLLISGAYNKEMPSYSRSMNLVLEKASPGRILEYGKVAQALINTK